MRRLPEPARVLATAARKTIERDGIEAGPPALYACQAEGPDSTQLGGCVKHYLDDHRLIFVGDVDADGRPFLRYLAAGPGHVPTGSRKPTAYQLADRRLNPRA